MPYNHGNKVVGGAPARIRRDPCRLENQAHDCIIQQSSWTFFGQRTEASVIHNWPWQAGICYPSQVSKKSTKISALIDGCRGRDLNAHYLGYFECFNQGWFYESHDVLEELWLSDRQGPNYGFYKGLIQFAGAFVHLQKDRLKPAAALFRLSRNYLSLYPPVYHSLDVARVIDLGGIWIMKLEAGNFEVNPLSSEAAPSLELVLGV